MTTRTTTLMALFSAFALATGCEDPSSKKNCDEIGSLSIDEGEDFGENPFELSADGETDEDCEPTFEEDELGLDDELDGSTDDWDEDLSDGFDDDWSDESTDDYDYDEYWY